jgi:uncharacterized 2Fe-2S/4Fe-4S cluster protein (DUF4445 family)
VAWITFMPWGKRIKTDGHAHLLELARRIDLPLQSACGGKKLCGQCKVIVEETAEPLPSPSGVEREALGDLTDQGYRLACKTTLASDAVVRIPEESQPGRPVILTSGSPHLHPPRLRPKLAPFYLHIPAPALHAIRGDGERLLFALAEMYGLKKLSLDPFALRSLPLALHSGGEGLTAVIWDKKEIIHLQSGRGGRFFGMAFDIGTTTVVGYLMDLLSGEEISVKSSMNPQIPYGDDVISRISFCREEAGGLEKLRSLIIRCLNTLIAECAEEAGIAPTHILEATVVGNTLMHHLFLGLDPRHLSMAPYPPVIQCALDFKARDLGMDMAASGYVHLLPLKAGFVGSDTIACILATGIHRGKALTLLVDLGTNGEIVLGNRDRMLCCSTAAGPAFEGGHIRWGMRASAGAIDRVKIDPVDFNVRASTVHDHAPLGLCGSGLISAVAEMLRAGLVKAKGGFDSRIGSPRLREGKDGLEFLLVPGSKTGHGQDIVITQRDLAELQMAKSAVHAGVALLTELATGEEMRRVILAGAVGNALDPFDALTIGLFPRQTAAEILAVGNAAGHGSCMALLDTKRRKEAEEIATKVGYQELAATERFQELFVSGLFFSSARDYEDAF